MKWNELSLKEKAELMKLYVSNGITKLDDIITHYNAYQEGGKITFEQWKQQMQQLYPDIEMDNTKAGYDYVRYFNDNYDDAIRQLNELRHFPDAYKLPNHKTFSNESIYSRSPMMGGNWINDSTFYPSIINRQQYPDIYKEDRPYTEREIYGNEYQLGGILNKIRSYFAPTYGGSFNQAYATAVKNDDEYFKWNGNRYNTKDSGIKRKPSQTMPDYSQLPFKEAYKKASKELPVKGEFGWNGAVYSANNAMENTDLTKIPVYKLWETVTGQPWSKAKEWGFTDGLAKTNIGLRKALLQVAKQCRKIENATPVEILRVLKNGYISTDIDNGFNVPLNETPITIKDSKAGQNQGTVFFPTVLDSLAVHGFNTNTSPVITFGLPAQESAMSPLYGHQTTDAEDFNNFAVGQMFSAWNVKTTPLDDLWKYVSDAKNDSEANMTIKNGAPYSFKKYADYILPSNIIDWSYNKFKSGTYNTGDENHTRDVIKRGTDFLQANEVQNWFYNHWLPGQSNQQEWIDWWNNYQQGGSLGKVTPYGQWQYPHQVTTIPSNNITMKGVDYPVIGVSNTGDTKYMLPNMDYLFDGQYVTEYPLHKFQKGGYTTNGITLADGRTLYPISDLPAEDTSTSLPAARIALKPVVITAKHPLWDLPDYKGKEDNPNINAHKNELYQNRKRREEAGKEYLKNIGRVGLTMATLPMLGYGATTAPLTTGLSLIGGEGLNYGVNKLTPYSSWGNMLAEGVLNTDNELAQTALEFTNPGFLLGPKAAPFVNNQYRGLRVANELRKGINNATKYGDIRVSESTFRDPTKFYRFVEQPEVGTIEELGFNVTSRDALDIPSLSNTFRVNTVNNKSRIEAAENPFEISFRKLGSAHGNVSQASAMQPWSGSVTQNNLFKNGILEGNLPSTILASNGNRSVFHPVNSSDLIAGQRIGFKTGTMPVENLRYFEDLGNGIFRYNGKVIPEKREYVLERDYNITPTLKQAYREAINNKQKNPIVFARNLADEGLDNILRDNYLEGSPSFALTKYSDDNLDRLSDLYSGDEGITFLFGKDAAGNNAKYFVGDADTPIRQDAARALNLPATDKAINNITPEQVMLGKRLLHKDINSTPINRREAFNLTRENNFGDMDYFYNEVLLDKILDYRDAIGAIVNTNKPQYIKMLEDLGIPYGYNLTDIPFNFKGFQQGGSLINE